MREFLFRAWDKSMGMSDIFRIGGEPTWNDFTQFIMYWKTECKILQYTGLKDSEGKKIFEGDVLRNIDGHIYDVIFEKGSWQGKNGGNWLHPIIFEDTVVIGNIHDNPELLG